MASRATQFRKVSAAQFEQREDKRHIVAITRATVRRHGNDPIEAVLHDLSIYGCRVRSPLEHSAGERIWVRFPGSLPTAATVVWAKDGFTGCRFDLPVPRALMRALTLAVD